MTTLTNERCVACRKDSPRVSDAEIAELKPQVVAWNIVEHQGILRLELSNQHLSSRSHDPRSRLAVDATIAVRLSPLLLGPHLYPDTVRLITETPSRFSPLPASVSRCYARSDVSCLLMRVRVRYSAPLGCFLSYTQAIAD